MQDAQRVEDTPVHEALREALVNTLIHADFSGRVSVLVVKRPDMFGFRNPGLMRIPIAQAVLGGNSDCWNRRLQKMFQLVGYGDQAGSGMPTIYNNWAGQHWRRPVLHELSEPEQTLMELRMTSLLPAQAVAELEAHLGSRFAGLSEPERLALVTAAIEGMLNHSRLREISTDHPTDISKMLVRLVKEGLLIPHGIGRGMVYYLPWQGRQEASLFEREGEASLSPKLDAIPTELPASYLEWSQLDVALQQELTRLALPVSQAKRASPDLLRATVLNLCTGRYLGRRVLAQLLNRNAHDLFNRTLTPLVEEKRLRQAFPSSRDPRQAYTTNLDADKDKN